MTLSKRDLHLDGYLPLDSKLSPRWQFDDLPLLGRFLTAYKQDDLWIQDTLQLPWPLQGIRKRARAFADDHIAPISAKLDLAEHLPAGGIHPDAHQLLVEAGKAGWLSYFLPKPLGSMPLLAGLYPPILQASLVVEEFSRACGGCGFHAIRTLSPR